MASNKDSVFGSYSGKIGNLTFYTMNGKTVVRTLPTQRKRKPTDKEVKNRNSFALVMATMQRVKSVIKIGFAHVARNRTAFQEAMSVNLSAHKNAIDRDSMHSWLQLSSGSRQGFTELKTTVEDGNIVLTWAESSPISRAFENDIVMVAALETNSNATYFSLGETKRKEHRCVIKSTPSTLSGTFDLYIFAVAPFSETLHNATLTSPSQWAGTVVL